MARGLMYSAVYFHRVTRVTEVMLSRAVERRRISYLGPNRCKGRLIPRSGRISTLQEITQGHSNSSKIQKALQSRKDLQKGELSTDQVASLVEIATNPDHRRSVEDDIASRAGLEPGTSP